MTQSILVVDDEASVRMTIAANLDLEGFEVVEAASGDEALLRLSERRFDLVLTDVRMPGMNGVELYRRIRARHANLPVILMTAFALEGVVRSALREGVFTLLPKPFEIDHLLAALTAAVRAPVVLVVDDVAPVAETCAAALRAAGVRAESVTSGERALEVVRSGSVDVCVVDMVMPDLDGATVIQTIHSIDRRVVCIAISGHDVREMFRKIATHVHAFMTKPIEPADLVEMIARARGATTRRA